MTTRGKWTVPSTWCSGRDATRSTSPSPVNLNVS
jgi:hypothetical protein